MQSSFFKVFIRGAKIGFVYSLKSFFFDLLPFVLSIFRFDNNRVASLNFTFTFAQ
jgi:hypothetical protein